MISSLAAWTGFHDKLAEMLNIFPTSLHAQYRFSTEHKESLPLDLTSEAQFNMMMSLLRPLVVPPRTATGRRSTRKMKPVVVQIFNKNDEPAVVKDAKVGRNCSLAAYVSQLCRRVAESVQKRLQSIQIDRQLMQNSFTIEKSKRAPRSSLPFNAMSIAFPTSHLHAIRIPAMVYVMVSLSRI